MSQSTPESRSADLANAQVTGGGGHEPDLSENGPADAPARTPAAGSGVDMKSDQLPPSDGG